MEFNASALEMLPGEEEQDGLLPCTFTCNAVTCNAFITG